MPVLITAADRAKLARNGLAQREGRHDPAPIVKLFTPDANATWLLTEIDPDEPERAFGLCDLGLGEPEMGYVCLVELARLRGPFGLKVERDRHFSTDAPLSRWAATARRRGRIVTPKEA